MAQVLTKYLKFDGEIPVLVDYARYDGSGLEISSTYLKKIEYTPYTLPIATNAVLGGIKIGAGLAISEDGTVSVQAGGVADAVNWSDVIGRPFNSVKEEDFTIIGDSDSNKVLAINPDNWVSTLTFAEAASVIQSALEDKQDKLIAGENITIVDNVISATGDVGSNVVANPVASATQKLTKLQVGDTIYNVASDAQEYELPIASATQLGGIKIGNNLSIDDDGVLSASSGDYANLTNAPVEKEFAQQIYDFFAEVVEEMSANEVSVISKTSTLYEGTTKPEIYDLLGKAPCIIIVLGKFVYFVLVNTAHGIDDFSEDYIYSCTTISDSLLYSISLTYTQASDPDSYRLDATITLMSIAPTNYATDKNIDDLFTN